jgi:hypothetical protein
MRASCLYGSTHGPSLRAERRAVPLVQSFVPADLRDIRATCYHGPRRSSASARARRSNNTSSNRRGAMPGSRRNLDVFRDVKAAVDLEATSRGGWTTIL